MTTYRSLIELLYETLKESRDHLEYCGYGDSWESECARSSGLPDRIDAALLKAEEALK